MKFNRVTHSSKLLCLASACAVSLSAAMIVMAKPAANTKPSVGQKKPASAAPQVLAGGIPVRFSLDKAGYVTLVIEDAEGNRVRNLIAETQLPAGDNLVMWDGYDDGTRDDKGNRVQRRVQPGQYRVRGLTHTGIRLNYEFPLYSGGNPPWKTPDKSGGWMADHSGPAGAVFLPAGLSPFGKGQPQVVLSSIISEAGDPTIFVDENGQRLYGAAYFGWRGGIAMARDMGTPTDPGLIAFAVNAWEPDNVSSLAVAAIRKTGDGQASESPIFSFPVGNKSPDDPGAVGVSLAVYNGLAVVSVPFDKKLVFIDTKERKLLGSTPLPSPRGVYFDAKGNLFAISNNTVKRFRIANWKEPKLSEETVLISTNLVEPHTLTGDDAGNLYVSDWGKLHQVKVFGADGKYKRVIGKPGGLQLGLYDDQRMHNPQGMTIDHKGRLWIAEADVLPKRISVWNAATGTLEMAKYGPPHYGGGGTIDAANPSRAFYAEHGGLMEFELDWKAGTSKLKAINSRKELQGLIQLPGENWWPERAVRVGGRTYLVGGYQGNLRMNHNSAVFLFDERTHIARPVAYVGTDSTWPLVKNDLAMKELMPDKENGHFLTWSDLNGDGNPQPNEIKYRVFTEQFVDRNGEKKKTFGYGVFHTESDLSMTGAWSIHVPAPTIRADGVPIYDLDKARFLLPPGMVQPGEFGEGTPVMLAPDGTILEDETGYKNGRQVWSYPARWDYNDIAQGPGDMNYATRALGPVMQAPAGEAGTFTAWNGEKGNIFLLTTDGFFIQQLGGDMRTHPLMRLPQAKRGMSVDGYSFEDEHFHPTMTRTDNGDVFLVAGKEHSSIFRVTGWDSVKRHDFGSLNLSQNTLGALPETKTLLARQQGRQRIAAALRRVSPTVDGDLNDWQGADWATMDANTSGAVAFSNDTLYAAWKTDDSSLLSNSGVTLNNLFKGGGALDLMIGTNRMTDINRTQPVEGDLRLLITQAQGKTRSALYRAVVPGTPETQRVLFESPIGKVSFDEVRDVSAEIKLAQTGGNYEISVPLHLLGMKLEPGFDILGDIGILRGNGMQTIQRLYWNNLNTAIVSDIPSEARLQPVNWGLWRIVADAPVNDGSVELRPEVAKLAGDNIRLKKAGEGDDTEYSIGFWDNPNASLQWLVAVPKAGKYRVDLTYGNGAAGSEFSFTAGAQKLDGKTVNTGGWDQWKTVAVGEMILPAGQSTFVLSPTAQLVGGLMDFKLLKLVPVP